MERLGLGLDRCLELNPRLVYGRVTGWGRTGPLAQAAGHDLNYLALTGALHSMGAATAPPPVPLNLLGDFAGGGMLLAFGMVCALFDRSRRCPSAGSGSPLRPDRATDAEVVVGRAR